MTERGRRKKKGKKKRKRKCEKMNDWLKGR